MGNQNFCHDQHRLHHWSHMTGAVNGPISAHEALRFVTMETARKLPENIKEKENICHGHG